MTRACLTCDAADCVEFDAAVLGLAGSKVVDLEVGVPAVLVVCDPHVLRAVVVDADVLVDAAVVLVGSGDVVPALHSVGMGMFVLVIADQVLPVRPRLGVADSAQVLVGVVRREIDPKGSMQGTLAGNLRR